MRPLLSSLGFASAASAPCGGGGDAAAQVEAIRAAMLDALGWPAPRGCEALGLRVKHAVDAQRLWYLRAELMQALAWREGEARAAERIAAITTLFRGVMPPSLA